MPARILIVEDEYIVAADLQMKLTRLGYQVVGQTVTGEEAIVLTDKHLPDVVLMDMQLQGRMNGMEAAETIRARHQIPIIFITAFAGMLQGDVVSEWCLSKPFSATELKEKLEACLQR
jgi:CheY-like chemotaxis protein